MNKEKLMINLKKFWIPVVFWILIVWTVIMTSSKMENTNSDLDFTQDELNVKLDEMSLWEIWRRIKSDKHALYLFLRFDKCLDKYLKNYENEVKICLWDWKIDEWMKDKETPKEIRENVQTLMMVFDYVNPKIEKEEDKQTICFLNEFDDKWNHQNWSLYETHNYLNLRRD